MKKIEKLLLVVSVLAVFTTSHVYADDMKTSEMMKDHNMMMGYPFKQLKHGVLAHDVKCNADFVLVLKSSDGSPACVKASTASILVMRGWTMSEDSMMKDHNMANENVENKSMTKTMPGDNMKTPNDSNQMSQSSMDESKYSDAPAFVGISDYINTTPAKLAQDMKGKVIVYDFWTYTCINCIHTLPHVVDLNNKYLSKDVLVIGIHSPEFEFEKDINNVKSAVAKYGIKYPVVLDNDHQTWDAFGNHYWPHIYIADAQGKLRYDHIGEGAYDEIDNTVASLLLEQENQKPKELVMG